MSEQPKEQRGHKGRAFLFWGGLIFTILAPLYIGLYLNDQSTSWVSFLIGVFLILMSKFDDIVEISLGPLRARMRERIKEADELLTHLRQIAAGLAEITLTHLMASNFIGGLALRKKLDFHDRLMGRLAGIGVTDSEREEIENMWRQGVALIYNRAIRTAVRDSSEATNDNANKSAKRKEISTHIGNMVDFSKGWASPSPEEYEKCINENGLMNDAAKEWINDYRHYLETGEIRRRDLFSTL